MSGERHSAPIGQHAGVFITMPLDSDRVVTQDTVQCVHCGGHWIWQPGSGRRRGFCMRCNGFTCGAERCNACVPLEQWLENVEAGRPEDYRPIIASVPAEPPRG